VDGVATALPNTVLTDAHFPVQAPMGTVVKRPQRQADYTPQSNAKVRLY